jgi:hypothetical protein
MGGEFDRTGGFWEWAAGVSRALGRTLTRSAAAAILQCMNTPVTAVSLWWWRPLTEWAPDAV